MATRNVVMTPGVARRMAKSVVRTERTPVGQPPKGAVTTAHWNPGIYRAIASTAIPTGTFASPSNTGRAIVYHKNAAGTYVADAAPSKILNDHVLTSSIASGKTIKVCWIDGDFWLLTSDC